jgi:hypothetical protein
MRIDRTGRVIPTAQQCREALECHERLLVAWRATSPKRAARHRRLLDLTERAYWRWAHLSERFMDASLRGWQ